MCSLGANVAPKDIVAQGVKYPRFERVVCSKANGTLNRAQHFVRCSVLPPARSGTDNHDRGYRQHEKPRVSRFREAKGWRPKKAGLERRWSAM
jgi:hypothetical protein